MVGLLLCEQPRDPRQRLGKVRRQFRTAGELAAHVARDTAEKGLQAPDLAACTPHLPRVRIAVRQAQCSLPRR